MVVVLPCVAQFVIVLDVTIVAIALPVVQSDLGLSSALLGWVVTVYPLVFGCCLVPAGRLADRIGRRRTFVSGLLVFGGASLACALAPSGSFLLVGRAVQGLGAALVSPAYDTGATEVSIVQRWRDHHLELATRRLGEGAAPE